LAHVVAHDQIKDVIKITYENDMNAKNALKLSTAILALAMSASASADFVGAYDTANWTISNPGGGAVDLGAAPGSITLTSGNAGIAGDTLFTIAAVNAATVSFDWSYVTNDLWGESGTDAFGYVLNGVFTSLINPNQDFTVSTQSGSATFSVNAGDVFGFNANTFDGLYGSSVTTVSAFNVAAVPVPGAVWLFGSVMGMFGVALRKRGSRG
jgi:hypothetical protein